MGRKPKHEEERVTNRIEELRVIAGLSRQELADRVGVHYQTIGYIERGEYSPSLVLALQIAHALDLPLENVFALEGAK
jgi:DNA-binding XRE family transcriptional regulator